MRDATGQTVLIEARSISKNFKLGERTITGIRQASFAIPDGSFTVIHGPSGSGKTTLLNVLTGLDKPSKGTVLYQGKNIYDLDEQDLAHFRARTMGIVHQSSYWVKSLSVLENVALPLYFLGYDRDNAEREALESLKRVGMDSYADSSPSLLSGGEQQRVSLARALVANPNYIVADEPTGNLDSTNGNAVMELLNYFHKELKRTIILVTHNEEYLRYATQVMHIKDGVVDESVGTGELARPSTGSDDFRQILEKLRPIRIDILIRMALANLRTKKFRNNLTMFGVAIGVGAVFSLLSFSLGLQNLVQKDIIGTDSVRVVNVTSVNSDVLKLDNQSVEKFESLGGVEKIGKQNTVATDFRLESASGDGVVYSIDQEYLALTNLTMVAGEKIQINQPNQLMISQSLISSLGYTEPEEVIGKEIDLTLKFDDGERTLSEPLEIVGVIESKSGSAMYVSQALLDQLAIDDFNQIKIVADSELDIAELRQQIESMGYQTTSPLDTIDQVNRFFNFFNVVLIGFGGIGMLIATTGMLNTLTVALLERTKEVGLMMALGARRRDMRRLFIVESLLLTIIGGTVGILLALILGFVVNMVSNSVALSRGVDESFSLFAVPWWLVVGTVVFMCSLGYLVSLLPAIRAGRIAPIDALRRE
ncbi:ABC transporter ATP-binding protein/permease [Candidatus Saccharibacteria bacterium]|nr:ABC transporter ATP-binding protein/permease [Candidatus Saccharibacteria bacterium]